MMSGKMDSATFPKLLGHKNLKHGLRPSPHHVSPTRSAHVPNEPYRLPANTKIIYNAVGPCSYSVMIFGGSLGN